MKYFLTTLTTLMAFGMLVVSIPVLAQDACEGQIGAGYGLCLSASHLGCGTESEQNTKACIRIENSFLKVAGEMPPWLAGGPCNVPEGHCRVFATSERFSSDFGGLTGADSQCQRLADDANLNGTFKAWLSSSTTPAKDRLVHADVPYTLVDDVTQVAANWGALTTPVAWGVQILDSPINTDEYGQPATENPYYRDLVWTGTTPEGETQICSNSGQPCTCGDWTGTGQINPGSWSSDTFRWSPWGGSSNCDKFYNNGGGASLYCFEQ